MCLLVFISLVHSEGGPRFQNCFAIGTTVTPMNDMFGLNMLIHMVLLGRFETTINTMPETAFLEHFLRYGTFNI